MVLTCDTSIGLKVPYWKEKTNAFRSTFKIPVSRLFHMST